LSTIDSDWPLAKDDTKVQIEAANPSNHITKAEARVLLKRTSYVLRHQCGIGSNGRLGEDVVLTISSGNPFLPILFYAVVGAGGALSGVGTSLRIGEMVRQVQDAGAKVIVCSPEYASVASKVATQCGIPAKDVLIIDCATRGHWTLREGTSDGADALEKSNGEMLDWERITDEKALQDTIVTLVYSSGTTGLPKGVRISHQNVVASCICTLDVARRYKDKHPDFAFDTIAHLPFANIAGIDMYCTNPVYMGGSTIWMQNYEYKSFIEYHRQFRPAYQYTVPPIWLRIAKDDNVTDHFDGLQVAVTGSAPIGTSTVKEIRKKLGKGKAVVAQTWGITEATGVITAMDWGDPNWSVGDLVPNMRLRIVDENGEDISDSSPGEMLIGGPLIAPGYHNKPEITRDSFKGGWFLTGDIGMAEESRHYIVDRKKELIKYKGMQVAPAELEALLTSHERIADAAVIGIWQEDLETEVPRAYIVRKGQIGASEIIEFVKNELAPYKQLRGGVEFLEEIPKSASGKILRKELRDKAKETPVVKL
jgi:acyl-CoA synthetase (AMP-forming)/AMP-acid ligase II